MPAKKALTVATVMHGQAQAQVMVEALQAQHLAEFSARSTAMLTRPRVLAHQLAAEHRLVLQQRLYPANDMAQLH